MEYKLKLFLNFCALFVVVACGGGGGGGGGSSFSITANSQSFSTNEDSIYIGNVTASTSSAVSVSFQTTSSPSFGTISLDSDGGFSYFPQAEFSGSDAFQFTATAVENSTVSNPATVSITINNVNDTPVVRLTSPPEAWAGNSDILMPENSIFEFTVDDPDNEFSEISYTASIGNENLPIPVIGESESGARTMSLDFTGVTSAGFKEVTIFANDGNSSGESIFEAIIPSNITLTENYRTYVVSGTKKQNMQPGTTYLIVADSITDIEDFRNRLGQTTYNLIKRINEGSFVEEYFNILAVEPILLDGTDSFVGLYTGCLDWDTSIYCWDWDVLDANVASAFPEGPLPDTISILAGFNGRGVARGYVNAQPLGGSTSYIAMHELGHSHANLGDEYITSDDRGVDMSIYADSSPNTTTNSDPYNVKWSHWIQDKTNVPGYTSGASNSGVGLFLGTYYSSDASWRPEDYNVMYGGDYNGGWGVPENFISQYGPINTEAFVAQTISNQCFNQYDNYDSCPNVWDSIYLIDGDGVETDIDNLQQDGGYTSIKYNLDDVEFNTNNIQLNWYINGILQEDLVNQTEVIFTKPENGGVMEYSYKATDTLGFITAPDDILLDSDNYEGFFNSEYYWNTSIDWSGSYEANPTNKSDFAIGYIDGTTGGTIGINWSNL
jgi:VCBS repeat-containing protein